MAILKIRDNNGNVTDIPAIRGQDGVDIEDVRQTTESTEDGGTNVITVALSNGQTFTFNVKNGSKGSKGDAYTLTDTDKTEIAKEVAEMVDISGGNIIINDNIKSALLNCFAHVAWSDDNGQYYYNLLEEALNVALEILFIQDGTTLKVINATVNSISQSGSTLVLA
jgi:hypothetical protein